jgi:hypothetical protein
MNALFSTVYLKIRTEQAVESLNKNYNEIDHYEHD